MRIDANAHLDFGKEKYQDCRFYQTGAVSDECKFSTLLATTILDARASGQDASSLTSTVHNCTILTQLFRLSLRASLASLALTERAGFYLDSDCAFAKGTGLVVLLQLAPCGPDEETSPPLASGEREVPPHGRYQCLQPILPNCLQRFAWNSNWFWYTFYGS